MDGLAWPALALLALAVVVRAGKLRDRIDWQSRGTLLLLSTVICVMFNGWLYEWRLLSAEESAAYGTARSHGLAAVVAEHYQPVLLPLLIGIVAVVIDVFSRLLTHMMPRAVDVARDRKLWLTLSANLLLFAATPALLYWFASRFPFDGSIVSDATRNITLPVISIYGAPACWLIEVLRSGWHAMGPWPWNPLYRHETPIALLTFVHDASPWMAFAIASALIAIFRSKQVERNGLADYFVSPVSATSNSLLHRTAFGPWRGRTALIFTALWAGGVAASWTLMLFVSSLGYLLTGAMAASILVLLVWLVSVLLRKIGRRG